MISLTTSGTPAETATAYGLLAIIADPAAAKARLDELAAEKQVALELHEAARKANADAAAAQDDATAKLAEAKRISDEFNTSHERRAQQLVDTSAELSKKQAEISDYQAAQEKHVAEKNAELTAREDAVKQREADVTAREEVVRQNFDQAQLLKEEWERKTTALRAALTPDNAAPKTFTLQAETGALGATMGTVG